MSEKNRALAGEIVKVLRFNPNLSMDEAVLAVGLRLEQVSRAEPVIPVTDHIEFAEMVADRVQIAPGQN